MGQSTFCRDLRPRRSGDAHEELGYQAEENQEGFLSCSGQTGHARSPSCRTTPNPLFFFTCYVQLKCGFFVKIPIFDKTLVPSLIAQPGPEDPQGSVPNRDALF